ncbi:MAG: CRISPR-associated helicase Cas3' [Aeromicrobium sp.]|nr:CRISPR-associated helicase Cas3' [Aeromicrobium sp.]
MGESTELYAHTPAGPDGPWHSLTDHLESVSALAGEFGSRIGLGTSARTLGIIHDLGKASREFQRYLRLAEEGQPLPPGSAPHKVAGPVLLPPELGLLQLAAVGHHSGLPDIQIAKAMLSTDEARKAEGMAEQAGVALPGPQEVAALLTELRAVAESPLGAELATRMLHSCLVDADALDTEAHKNPGHSASRGDAPSLDAMWRELEDEQRKLIAGAVSSVVNDVRCQVYEDCIAAAEESPGFFRLTVPTGGGKTRSSLAFALRHALAHGLDRIVYAIPYTSIIDQTAGVFRGLFADDRAVLEHHSALEESSTRGSGHELDWRALTAENWDAPLIVTTTVQLFDSLFSGKPAAARKIHRLANAVIVLDEAQCLPGHVLKPIVSALEGLVNQYGSSVVLCTATQPALDELSSEVALTQMREIIHEPERHFAALRRVDYDFRAEPVSWDDLASEVRMETQCLVVLNTRKDALALGRSLAGEEAVMHLSTLLCPAHRRAVLGEVKRRLSAGEPCRLISTQVVEAGVDLDFPIVFRALGPLDRVAQAAGRCNREGERPVSPVVIFEPMEGGMPPGEYATAVGTAQVMLASGERDLHDPRVFTEYFSNLYGNLATDREDIQRLREHLQFDQVRRRFHMIGDESVPVLVAFDEARLNRLVGELRGRGVMTRKMWQEAQQISVSLRRRELDTALRIGLATEAASASGVYCWQGDYDSVFGLVAEAADQGDLIA